MLTADTELVDRWGLSQSGPHNCLHKHGLEAYSELLRFVNCSQCVGLVTDLCVCSQGTHTLKIVYLHCVVSGFR